MKILSLLSSAFSLLLALNLAADTTDSLSSNLVIFKPEVHVQKSEKPCQGIRVSDHEVATSPECARHIADQLSEHSIMANGHQNEPVGQIALSSTHPVRLVLFNHEPDKASSRYPVTVKRPIIGEQEARSVELSCTDESIVSLPLRLSPEGNGYRYSRVNDEAPAPGSPVVAGKRLICVTASDHTCIPVYQGENRNPLQEEDAQPEAAHQELHKRSVQNNAACSACQAQLNQLLSVCQTACTGKINGMACALCAKKVDIQAAKCKSICR